MRILLVEDEAKTAAALKIGLENSGYTVDVANDGFIGLSLFKSYHYAIVISDVIMPKINGFDLCRQIRKVNTQIPILFLTALFSKEQVVTGLDSGADDYLTKPFDFSELLARIRVLLKRSALADTLTFADLEIHLKSKQVNRGGVSIELTAKEFKLLEYFMERPNTVNPMKLNSILS